jgi:hypothetical protein
MFWQVQKEKTWREHGGVRGLGVGGGNNGRATCCGASWMLETTLTSVSAAHVFCSASNAAYPTVKQKGIAAMIRQGSVPLIVPTTHFCSPSNSSSPERGYTSCRALGGGGGGRGAAQPQQHGVSRHLHAVQSADVLVLRDDRLHPGFRIYSRA